MPKKVEKSGKKEGMPTKSPIASALLVEEFQIPHFGSNIHNKQISGDWGNVYSDKKYTT